MMKYCLMTFQKVMSQFPNLVLLTRRDTSTLHSASKVILIDLLD